MILGQYRISGSTRSFSQFRYVKGFTPSFRAMSRCRSPRSDRRFLRCSPRVLGVLHWGSGLNDFNAIGRFGRKATRKCRCGHLADPALACPRAPKCALEYQSRLSGPLLDRIDIYVDVPAVEAADLSLPPPAEGSAQVAARVTAARTRQRARYDGLVNGDRPVRCNADLDGETLDRFATPDAQGRALLAQAAGAMKLTARGYHRVLRVARTLADLDGAESIARIHVAEALGYRRLGLGR